MSEHPVLRIASVIFSITGLVYLIAQGAVASIFIGKGIVSIIAAGLGFSLVKRLPDSVHEYFRKGQYLPHGSVNRRDLVYPPGSSKSGTFKLSLFGVISGLVLVIGGFFLGPVDVLFVASSVVLFALKLIVSRPGAMERMLIVTWTVPQVWSIMVFTGIFWTYFGTTAAVVSLVLIHSITSIFGEFPASREMVRAAERANEVLSAS